MAEIEELQAAFDSAKRFVMILKLRWVRKV